MKAAVLGISKADGTSINQFVTTAVAEKVSAMRTAEFFTRRATEADIAAARRLLRREGGQPPETEKRYYKDKTYRTHLLRRSFRQDGKVKHETLGNISHLPEHIIDLIRRALRGETFVNPEQAFTCCQATLKTDPLATVKTDPEEKAYVDRQR